MQPSSSSYKVLSDRDTYDKNTLDLGEMCDMYFQGILFIFTWGCSTHSLPAKPGTDVV